MPACLRALQDCEQHPLPAQNYECPMCLEKADEWSQPRRWLGLPRCGHVFCSSCALTLAGAGECECPVCRSCWHLPQLEVGSRVRIEHHAARSVAEDEPAGAGKGVAVRVPTNAKGQPSAPPRGRGPQLTFWKTAAKMLHGKSGVVEALSGGEHGGAVSVRLDHAERDHSEGTGLAVALVSVAEQDLVSVESDIPVSASQADALAKPGACSLAQLEELGLLLPALVRCTACQSCMAGEHFSHKQLKKGSARCKKCVEERRFATALVSDAGRKSQAQAKAAVDADVGPCQACGAPDGAHGWWAIQGLQKRPDLNGLTVRLLEAFDRTAEYLGVRVEGASLRVKVRPKNLVWKDAAPAPATEPNNVGTASPLDSQEAPGVATTPADEPSVVRPATSPAAAATPPATSPSPPPLSPHVAIPAHALAQMARALLESGAFQIARQVAHRALEEAASAIGGESEKDVSARQRGVSLARNVLANASDEIAQQGWAVALALNEAFERRVSDVLTAAEAVASAAMDAAGAIDAQLGDPELLVRASGDEMSKLEAKRAHATALLERATDLVRSVRREEADQKWGGLAAERAVEEVEAERERQRASDALHAMGMQVDLLRSENERLVGERVRLQTERDEAVEIRDEMLCAASTDDAGAASSTGGQRQSHGGGECGASSTGFRLPSDQRAPHDRLIDRLTEGSWRWVRQEGGHPVYKRTVIYDGESETKEQTFTHAATPSDSRSMLNSLSDLRSRDNNVITVLPVAANGEAAWFARLNECHRRRKEQEVELSRTHEEICMLEGECGFSS